MTKLGDIGERGLVNGLLARRYSAESFAFGDDCAVLVQTPGGAIVGSVDPAPRPVAWELGFKDYFHWGWLLGAINLSDLAAAGAQPLSMLTSYVLPVGMELEDFSRFLDGLDACARTYDCPVVGGNVTDGLEFRCEATVTGKVAGGLPFSRRGARLGDRLVAIGRSGHFWSGVLTFTNDYCLKTADRSELLDAIVRPVPQVDVGLHLQRLGKVRACTDASDGLYYAMRCMTVGQGLGLLIEPSMIDYPDVTLEVAALAEIEPFRLLLGFGDMQLVAAVPAEDMSAVSAAVEAHGQHLLTLGVVTDTGRLEMRENGVARELSNFDNERLSAESQLTAGLAAYRRRLLERPLIRSAGTGALLR